MTKEELAHYLAETAIELISTSILAVIYTVPFFNLPIIRNLASMAVRKIISIGVYEGELRANYWIIDGNVSKECKDFEKAAIHDKEVQANGSPEDKEKSRQAKMDAFRAFAKLHPPK